MISYQVLVAELLALFLVTIVKVVNLRSFHLKRHIFSICGSKMFIINFYSSIQSSFQKGLYPDMKTKELEKNLDFHI